MLILAGTIRIGAGHRDAALGPIVSMVEATRREPGCLAALAAHRASAHMATWRAAMPALEISGRDMSEYQVERSRKI